MEVFKIPDYEFSNLNATLQVLRGTFGDFFKVLLIPNSFIFLFESVQINLIIHTYMYSFFSLSFVIFEFTEMK